MFENGLFSQILLQVVLIALNAVFACAEIAVISANESKLTKLAEDGNKRAKKLTELTNQPARFLATIQVTITLSGFLGSAFAADNFSDIIVNALINAGVNIPEKTLNTIAVIVITILLSFLTLVFGELVPKRIAMRKSDKVALSMSGLISIISKIFAPIVWLLTASTNGILRLLGIDPNTEDEAVSEEEIRMLADAGSERGIIDKEENEIIQNVFEFDDLTAEEIATHRTEIDLIWDEDDIQEWEKVINSTDHSYYPICKNSVDNIIGILDARIYFRLSDRSNKEYVMKNAVKPAYFVPESMKADLLFRNMKKEKTYFAIVIDEFGGTHGIVTINDLLERLVGEFELYEDKNEIQKIDEITYKIICHTDLDKIEKLFDININSDSATVSGWIIEQFGKIPEKGDTFTYDGLNIIVEKTDRKKVIEITVKKEISP